VPELAIEIADRRIGAEVRGHCVEHRREVDVHAGRVQLVAPAAREPSQLLRRNRALLHGAHDPGEPRPLKPLDEPAFLVGRDEQLHAARCEPLQLPGDVLGCLQPGGTRPIEDHRADVILRDRIDRRAGHAGRRTIDHQELTNPLPKTHPVERALRERDGSR